MSRASWEEALVADLVERAETPTRWRTCPRCRGKCTVPEQPTLDGLDTGIVLMCPECRGLGKVPKEDK